MDPYQVLGVEYGVNDNDLKKAYRKLVREYHPDVNSSEEARQKFADIEESYRLLSHGKVVLPGQKIGVENMLSALFQQPRKIKVNLPIHFFDKQGLNVIRVEIDKQEVQVSVPDGIGQGDIIFVKGPDVYLELNQDKL